MNTTMKLIGNISTELSPTYKIALEASFGKKIKDSTNQELTIPLIKLFGESYEILGQKTPDNMTSVVKLLRIELSSYFGTYAIEEVINAIKMGVTGKLCELNTITMPVVSVANFCKFIHLYNEKIRKNALHEQRAFEEKNNQEEEKLKAIKGNERLDKEIADCKDLYLSDKDSINNVSEQLRACYYRRLRQVNGKRLLSLEVMEQLNFIADGKHDTFEDLPKQEQHYMAKYREVEKWNKERLVAVKTTAQAMALPLVFDLK